MTKGRSQADLGGSIFRKQKPGLGVAEIFK